MNTEDISLFAFLQKNLKKKAILKEMTTEELIEMGHNQHTAAELEAFSAIFKRKPNENGLICLVVSYLIHSKHDNIKIKRADANVAKNQPNTFYLPYACWIVGEAPEVGMVSVHIQYGHKIAFFVKEEVK